jgi:hypothetical protein
MIDVGRPLGRAARRGLHGEIPLVAFVSSLDVDSNDIFVG